jgi:hypothetical protein
MAKAAGLEREVKLVLGLVVSAVVALFGASPGANVRPPSDATLAAYGLPPRPNAALQPQQYATWLRVVRAARAPLDVTFVTATGAAPERVIEPDWAGAVLFAPGARPMRIPPRRFTVVEGEWTVPFAKPTINCSNRSEPTDGSSLWIALDGWMNTYKAHAKGKDGKYYAYDSSDLLQAGSESDVPCYRGVRRNGYPTSSYFWIEWDGTKNIAVSRRSRDLALHAGDTIYVKIAADTTGPHAWRRATLWFVDETTGFYLPSRTFDSGCVDCGTPYERPATLAGNTAEWMAEATFYSSENRTLPNSLNDFGTVGLTTALATDEAGMTYSPGAPGAAVANLDWMTWQGVPLSQNGTLLACSSLEGAATVRFARAPYAIASPGQQGDLEPKPHRCR